MLWYGMVCHGMAWYGMVWYGMVWYGMVWYGVVWYGMVWYGMVWHGMVWLSSLPVAPQEPNAIRQPHVSSYTLYYDMTQLAYGIVHDVLIY